MQNMLKVISIIALIAGVAGCVSTSEMELAPNVVMLQTSAGGALYAGRSGPEMLKKAAEVTLSHGYTCFALSGAQMNSGSQYAGSIGSSGMKVSGFNNGGSFSGVGTGFESSTPIYRHTETAGATVTMSKTCGPSEFHAVDILKRSAQS
jgi:hypothetical protein